MMRRFGACSLLVLLAACSPPDRKLPPGVDPMLRQALGEGANAYHAVTRDEWVVVSTRPERAGDWVQSMIYVRSHLVDWLGRFDLPPPPPLVVVDDPGHFQAVLGKMPGRPHARGVSLKGALLLGASPDDPSAQETLAHEMTHAALRAAHPGMPLWLEEGLAQHWGVAIARERLRILGIPTEPAPPVDAPGPEAADPDLRLTRCAAYPEHPIQAAAFHRQAGAWVEAVDRARGGARWPDLLRALTEAPADWRDFLKLRFHIPEPVLQRLDALDRLPAHGEIPEKNR